jgi:hypothetical protein
VCNKILGNFDKSQDDYGKINQAFELQEGTTFSKKIFAMIMLPLINRKN